MRWSRRPRLISPVAGPVQTVCPRGPPGCRPRRRAGGGAGGGSCWGGRGRRGGAKRPFGFPIRFPRDATAFDMLKRAIDAEYVCGG